MTLRPATERFAPTLQALPGFWGDVAGVDRATGQVIRVSTWETEAQAQAATEAATRLRRDAASANETEATRGATVQPNRVEGILPRYYEVIARA